MNTGMNRIGPVAFVVGMGALALGLARTAEAGCSFVAPQTAPEASKESTFAVYYPAADAQGMFRLVSDTPVGASIVGLWKFEMLAKSTPSNQNPMPDGSLVDFGTQAWHSDGTELMNSGSRNPADGDFCQGMWRQVGPSTYELYHMPLAWGGGSYVGPTVIQARVTVTPDRQHFGGTFKLTAYSASPTPGNEFDLSTPLVTITGTIAGTRFAFD